MKFIEEINKELAGKRCSWLITGAAGFIGSHLVETLLELNQQVTGLDNLSTGSLKNIELLQRHKNATDFDFIEGDIRDEVLCREACEGVNFVLHQAALGSVPRSFKVPLETHGSNVTGFIDMITAAKEAEVKAFVYASSSSVYGDEASLPKVEERTGTVLSPYAAGKAANELYAAVYGQFMPVAGLRYFNVFGPRQSPDGPYAAVIPRWMENLHTGQPCRINGDGETSRDFCYVANAVQANLRAALAMLPGSRVYNVAAGRQTTLNQLHSKLSQEFAVNGAAEYGDFREGDIRHSLANISRINKDNCYNAEVDIDSGLKLTVEWFKQSQAE